MLPRHLLLPIAGFGLSTLAIAPPAQAHIRLLDPVARYDITGFDTGIKSCPCGLGGSNRTCNLPAGASDPDRSTRVKRAEAGSTITLRFEEYVDHSGTFRVAFDPEGADFADFNSNILVPMVPDPSGGAGNVGEGDIWEIDVQLPDMTCDNCTLQLIQAMNGDLATPVSDPARISTYYACVDLELVPRGTLDDMGGTDDPAAENPDSMGAPNEPMPPANPGAMGSNGGSTGSSGGSMTSSGGTTGSNLGSAPATGADTTSSNAVAMTGNGVGSGLGAPATNSMGNSQSPGGLTNIPAQGSDASSASSGGCGLGTERTSGGSVLAAVGLLSALAAGRRHRRKSVAR